mgnify:CR=1 FL=1
MHEGKYKMTSMTGTLQKIDLDHHLHPFTDTKVLGEKGSRIITKAEGIYLWDSDGNKILDGMAGLWCVNIGYGRQELIDVAKKQMEELPYYNNFFMTTHPPAVDLSKELAKISPPQFNHVFFTNSGSEANDTMIRMVRHYWSILGKPEKKVIISRENAYHGSTLAASSLGGMKFMHSQGGVIHGVVHIDQPYWFKEGQDMSPEEFGMKTAQSLEDKIKEMGVDNVAAFIAEPVQGAGGVIVPPDSYWPEIQRICNEYEILLVADEVICGFGRLGQWFGSDHYNINADLMPIAKGLSSGYLPIGGLMVSDEIANVIIDKGGEFAHGFTYSGHPAACVVAQENIRIMKEEKIVEYVRETSGPYLQKRWNELGDSPIVGETRGIGMVAALEIVKDKESNEPFPEDAKAGFHCREFCFDNGLVMRAVGDKMIISPPLIMTESEIDELIDKAGRCLDLTAEKLGIN